MAEIKLPNPKEIKIKKNNYLNTEHIKIYYIKNILGFYFKFFLTKYFSIVPYSDERTYLLFKGLPTTLTSDNQPKPNSKVPKRFKNFL